jgi:cellulose biosynthesis protein BcsQ
MVITGWSVKGGSGTTVMCAALAATLARSAPTVLVDLCGDAPALFGSSTVHRQGLLDWLTADGSVGPETIGNLIDQSRRGAGPDLLPASAPDSSDDCFGTLAVHQRQRLEVGMRWLAETYDRVVVDAGSLRGTHAEIVIGLSTATVLVMRPCTMAVRAALRSKRSVVGAVVVGNGSGSLRAHDVEALLGVPVFGHVPTDRSIPAAVDAGTFGVRIPRQLRASVTSLQSGLGLAT